MANQMTAWTQWNDDTDVDGAPHEFQTCPPMAAGYAWNDEPTRGVSGSRDSEALDAAALFADLEPVNTPPSVPPMVAVMLPPPVPLIHAPIQAPTPSSLELALRRRASAPTVRIRHTLAAWSPRRAMLTALAICGSFAFVAGIAACLFYSAAPRATPPTATATATANAIATLSL